MHVTFVELSTPQTLLLGGGALLVLAILVVLFFVMRRKGTHDPDAGLGENLGDYPPSPPAGTHRLSFEGQPVRLRLVILAPSGRNASLSAGMAEGLLQAVVHGMGEVADLDRPRVRVWPGQLSQDGFAPKFFDNVRRPEAAGQMSPWIIVAGPAKAGQKTILVGLALEADDDSTRGNVRLKPEQWADKFRIRIQG